MKRYWPLIVFGAIHAVILLVLFNSSIYNYGSMQHDVSLFFNYSSKIVGGQLPYRDFTVEYPPLAFVFFTLPRLVATTLSAYQHVFAMEILLFDLLGLFLAVNISRRLGLHPVKTLVIYTVLVLAIGPLMVYRFDIIPAVIVLLVLYAAISKKFKLAWVLLALGVMTKVYPLVIAPVLLLYQINHRRYREACWGIFAFSMTLVIITVFGLLLSPSAFWDSFKMQMQRGLHSESTYASFLLLGQTIGLTHASIQTVGPTPLSVNLVSPLANTLAKIAPAVMIPALLLVYWLFYRRNKNNTEISLSDTNDIAGLINYSLIAVMVFMLTGSILSPQFIIWLYPLVPLVAYRWRQVPWFIFILVSILTFYLYPLHYDNFKRLDAPMISILLLRNISLMTIVGLLIDWKIPITVSQRQSSVRLPVKLIVPVIVLVLTVSSILYAQLTLKFTNIQGGPGGGSSNGFPNGPSNRGQPDGSPGNPSDGGGRFQ